jgi:protein-S-isoprenylcysteine O-methyltransferase Ste14
MPVAPLPLFSMPWTVAFWAVYVWAFYISEFGVIRHTKETRGAGPERPQDSLASLMLLTMAAKGAALLLAWYGVALVRDDAAMPVFWLGLTLMLAGSLLRRHCFKMLGSSFTVEVRASADQPLVSGGAYRLVRHPGYLAGMIMLTGFGLATTSFLATLIVLAAGLFAYTRRIDSEERAMLDAMGDRYRSYAATRKKLIPFIY